MTKKRAEQYWEILKNATDCSKLEAQLLVEAIRVLNEKNLIQVKVGDRIKYRMASFQEYQFGIVTLTMKSGALAVKGDSNKWSTFLEVGTDYEMI
jgi:hypothetical protein